MSRQTLMESFYNKSKSPVTPTNNNVNRKRPSLSLKKCRTPKKVHIKNYTHLCAQKDETVIELSSGDESNENEYKTSQSSNENSQRLNSNQSSVSSVSGTPRTPQKSPRGSSSSNSRSPSQKSKYFSPVKKRAVFKTPIKRNLTNELKSCSPNGSVVNDEDFMRACEDMDDKSIFLLTIINKCLKHDRIRDLLDENCQHLLNRCLHLTKPGVRLVCRLYWRQHTWYKREHLMKMCSHKETVGDDSFNLMMNCLFENRLVAEDLTGDDGMTFDDYTKLLKGEELKQICKDLKLKIQSKQSAVDALCKFSKQSSISKYFAGNNSNNSRRVLQIMKSKAGPCYKLSELASATLYKLYVLMFLGMDYNIIREKRLELVLINNKVKTETYPVVPDSDVDDASVVFRDRDHFNKYLKAHIMYESYLSETQLPQKCTFIKQAYKMYQDIDINDLERYQSLPTWLRRYTPANIYVKIMETGIQELKKEKCDESYQLAIDILSLLISQTSFRQHSKAEWFAEKALILHKLMARHDEAAEVLIEGLKSNLSEEEKDIIRPRALKIANQLNINVKPELKQELNRLSKDDLILESSFPADHIAKNHMESPSVQRGKKKFIVDTPEGRKFLDAEDYCVHYYTTSGCYTDGNHWEGRIITTIFFLLFWDIIYTKPRGVAGVFLSHFQRYPLDMFTECFYLNRKKQIDDWLRTMEEMDIDALLDVMHQTWEKRPEHELSGIHRNISWDSLAGVVRCLGVKCVATLCLRLASHRRPYSGFPDLTLWDSRTGLIKFVEVKTDTDKPSRKQLQWMQYLKDNDIDTGFCYIGANTTRCKARAGETSRINVKSVEDINREVKLTD